MHSYNRIPLIQVLDNAALSGVRWTWPPLNVRTLKLFIKFHAVTSCKSKMINARGRVCPDKGLIPKGLLTEQWGCRF